MEVLFRIEDLRRRLARESAVAIVPTMGNLHDGHIQLVRLAREKSDFVIASIFVNRLQFGPREDFDRYPRSIDADCEMLRSSGVAVVFAPGESDLYPEAQDFFVEPPAISQMLEGRYRNGFFRGVSTVVLKLFNIVQPGVAVFGKKDYQQLRVIQHLVRQFALPIRVIAGETARAPDGLAHSSRNAYLPPKERAEAPRLFEILRRLIHLYEEGRRDFIAMENEAIRELKYRGWQPDYLSFRNRDDLSPATAGNTRLVVVAAAKLGTTRLIDNLETSP